VPPASLFAEIGFDATTTTAIAVRAGMSTGSLYQFFPNKDAIVEALAGAAPSNPGLQLCPRDRAAALDALIDRVVDPLVELHVAHPGFWTLFGGSSVSPRPAAATGDFHWCRARARRGDVRGRPAERDAVVRGLKAGQRGYLKPIFAGHRLKD
jgi:AcrR family transcriptional regulator